MRTRRRFVAEKPSLRSSRSTWFGSSFQTNGTKCRCDVVRTVERRDLGSNEPLAAYVLSNRIACLVRAKPRMLMTRLRL